MSSFFFEDTVTFSEGPSIVGTINLTWSEVDAESSGELTSCYVHKNLPSHIKKAWFTEERLLPGFVIVEFLLPHDGFCLVAETSLKLIDRGLAVGDVVKRKLSDIESGTVISTSVECTLQPLCKIEDYSKQHHVQAQGHTPSHGPYPTPAERTHLLLHGFPVPQKEPGVTNPIGAFPSLQVPAQELTYWNDYREEDYILYRDWVGRVTKVYDEVTIRLTNGSVVTVEDSTELEEPFFRPGTTSYELAQRLDAAGYYQHIPRRRASTIGKPQSALIEFCYPGQTVQTKKGNLRRGQWKFGVYDPNVAPQGIVVEVRCMQIEVDWIFANICNPSRTQVFAPSQLLDTDDLGHETALVYDRSRLPKKPVVATLPNASYSPDTGFGHRVRFKDPAGAAVKYSSSPNFNRIPRTATQGFDMNVFQVMTTRTKALVRWQDFSCTEVDSTSLIPYLYVDEHDVWPGEKVSFKPDEVLPGAFPGMMRTCAVGVVQTVDAAQRLSLVRWFEGATIDLDARGKDWQLSTSTYGRMGDKQTETTLYDIASYPAFDPRIGDLAVIFPELMPPLNETDVQAFITYDEMRRMPLTTGLRAPTEPMLGVVGDSAIPLAIAVDRARQLSERSNHAQELSYELASIIGEVVDTCLDGQVVVRLGASSDTRDVRVSLDRIVVIASADSDPRVHDGDLDYSVSNYTDDEELDLEEMDYASDVDSYQETDMSVEPIDITIEYEGGHKLEASGPEDEDEEMWTTDEESDQRQSTTLVPAVQTEYESDKAANSNDISPMLLTSYSSMPSQFAVLDESAPTDHHFFKESRNFTADTLRRVMKEHKILQSSLPDGVFVRTWESRLDLLRVLIIGPTDTPYEFAPFLIDLQFGPLFPNSPPDTFFHSWTSGLGRINPNLYENGKICLSLLGTWPADERNEGWSSKTSTVLQIIVSIMGLVLVKEPYYSKQISVSASAPQ